MLNIDMVISTAKHGKLLDGFLFDCGLEKKQTNFPQMMCMPFLLLVQFFRENKVDGQLNNQVPPHLAASTKARMCQVRSASPSSRPRHTDFF